MDWTWSAYSFCGLPGENSLRLFWKCTSSLNFTYFLTYVSLHSGVNMLNIRNQQYVPKKTLIISYFTYFKSTPVWLLCCSFSLSQALIASPIAWAHSSLSASLCAWISNSWLILLETWKTDCKSKTKLWND